MQHSLMPRLPRRAFPVALTLAGLSLVVPATSYAQTAPRMVICAVANTTDDDGALDKARKAMADAKDKDSPAAKQEQERARAGLPPLFPNPEPAQTVTPLQMAAAASLPQLGLGDSLLGLALLNQPARDAVAEKEKPLPNRYRWVELRQRELRLLELDEAGFQAKSPAWQAVAKAREKGEPCVLDDLKWIVSSRATKDGVVLFLLVREPSPAYAVTDEYLENVRLDVESAPFTLTLTFKDAEGRERLQDMTSVKLPPKDGRRYLTIVVRNQAVVIAEVDNVLKHGRMELSGDFGESEIKDTFRKLQTLVRRTTGGQ